MADTNEPAAPTGGQEPEQTPNAPAEEPAEASLEDESLEGNDGATKETSGAVDASKTQPSGSAQGGSSVGPPPTNQPSLFKWLRRYVNIYTMIFLLVMVVALAIIAVAYHQSRHAAKGTQVKTQGLSQSTLDQLANSDVTVGNNNSVLTVQSSAIFAGQVLIRQNLEVAGNLRIGGTVSLNNIAISGTSQLGQVNISRDLAVSGNTALQGSATINKSLQVGGGGTFSGPLSAPQITAGTLQLNGDLVLTHHITVGGGQPSRSSGSALGSGGSVSLSGSDTAGSISINTGGGPGAGCFVTVNFTAHYNSTPHVIVTPIGSAAGGLSYYVNRSAANFSICVASPPPAGSSFGFDYFVVD